MDEIAPKILDCKEFSKDLETVWIPLSDGRKLAARIVLPKTAFETPVPCILEYIPYRRRDGTRARDELNMFWFSANGYAYARVDISGTGDSDGLVEDEYVLREQDDGLELIDWLSKQRWCSGAVGMIGISWGGFNGLQIAARRPTALKAVISLCSTVDRFNDDVHYMGGCLLNDNLDWGAAFFTYGALPPDPEIVGEKSWKKIWEDRINGIELFPAKWLKHQSRDVFWKHGSVKENYGSIDCPVMAISGWADGYTSAVFELVENLSVTCKGIIGPWGHKFPHQGVPGPAIGFLQEAKRWWDRWLKNLDTGVENDPDMRLFVQDPMAPAPHIESRKGTWLGIPNWPSPFIKMDKLFLSGNKFVSSQQKSQVKDLRSISSPENIGVAGGEWCAYALGKIAPELPLDQKDDDAYSLTFDSDLFSTAKSIIGQPIIHLRIASDQPQALIAVRLNNINTDGTIERISYGFLNLSHRDSNENPAVLKPSKYYDVSIKLKHCAYKIKPDCKLRMSISTSYWPMVWPSPHTTKITLNINQSYIKLPVLTNDFVSSEVSFQKPEHAKPLSLTVKKNGVEERKLIHNIGEDFTEFKIKRDDGVYIIDDIGTQLSYKKNKNFRVKRNDPLTCRAEVDCEAIFNRGAWKAQLNTTTALTSDEKFFYLSAKLTALCDGEVFAERHFNEKIRRLFL